MEKRKEKRFVEFDDVLIKDERLATRTAGKGEIGGFTHDLSVSGTRIISEQNCPVGCAWRMLIDLKRTNEALVVDGKVVWVRKSKNGQRYHIGVEFLHKYPNTICLLIKHLYGRNGNASARAF